MSNLPGGRIPHSESALEISINGGTTLDEALRTVRGVFAAAGISEAQTEARFLLQGLLNIDAATWVLEAERLLAHDAPRVIEATRRRLSGEPVSRILGVRYFYGRAFKVTPDVLDPRADTETLVDAVLETLKREAEDTTQLTIADVGCGSGAIIATLLAQLPAARGIATDVSAAALAVTRENAERLGIGRRLQLFETPGLLGIDDRIDVVVSNPPYIPSADIAALDAGVRKFDPAVALDGGRDGLEVFRIIFRHINKLERVRRIFLEVGAGQADEVERLFSSSRWESCGRWRDLGGIERVVALKIHR
jgi:release factor glutamine methyltransferase